jgi:hypothetical protein
MPQVETVAVVCPWDHSIGRVLMNRSEYDPNIHTLWENYTPPSNPPQVEPNQAMVEVTPSETVDVFEKGRLGRRRKITITREKYELDNGEKYELWPDS